MAWMASLKIFLISSGVLFMALAMKVSVPLLLEFTHSHLPQIWRSFLSWLRPPYLYVITNAIIIIIAACSRFHHNRPDTTPSPPKVSEDLGYHHQAKSGVLEQPEVVQELREEKPTEYEQSEEYTVTEVKTVEVNNATAEAEDEDEEEDKFVTSGSAWTPPIRSDSLEILLPAEKPLVSARFGHRKPVKSNPEGTSSSHFSSTFFFYYYLLIFSERLLSEKVKTALLKFTGTVIQR